MKTKLLTLFIFALLFISITSAFSWTSVGDYVKDGTTSEYGKYNIYEKHLYLFKGDLKLEVQLEENTRTCGGGELCYAYFNSKLLKDGTLVDSFNIYNLQTMQPDNMRWYRLEYYGDVIDYETQCTDLEPIITQNGTKYTPQKCNNVEVGKHKDWIIFKEGEVLPASNYYWRAVGDKAPWKDIEWTFTKDDIETTEWAVWGGVIGVGGVTANVTLNSPANASTALTNPVTFNASANVTGGAYLTNMSFCSNMTGSWGCGVVFTATKSANPTGLSMTNGGARTEADGAKFIPKINLSDGFIVIKHGSVTATTATLKNEGGSTLATSTFSGNNASFSYSLVAGTKYTIVINSGGSSYTQYYSTSLGSSSFNISKTTLDWTNGVLNGVEWDRIYNVIDIYSLGDLTSSTQTWSKTIPAGSTLWNVQACDSDGDCGFSVANYTVNLDSGAPTIALNYPTALIDYGKLNGTLQLNFTVTDTNLDKVWYTYRDFNYSTQFFTDKSNLLGRQYSCETIGNYSVLTSIPSTCSIGGINNITVRYYGSSPPKRQINCTNSTGNYQIDDYSLPIASSLSCIREFTELSYLTGAVSGVANLSNITLSTKKNVTIYANDTAGNLNATTFSWDYKVFENSRSYTTPVYLTTIDEFKINITEDGSQIPIVYLVYNGTSTLASLINGQYSTNVSLNTVGNISFYWSILYGTDVINTTTSIQEVSTGTILNVTSSNCASGLVSVMNFKFANEQNLTNLTEANIKYNFKYGISNSTAVDSYGSLNNISTFNLCLNTTQSPTYQIGYGEIEYAVDGYTTRRFYLFNNTRVSNSTINTTLYSLANADSTSFLVEVRTPALGVYQGKYITLLRWYPDLNQYKVVEMGKTDDKGQSVTKVKIEDADYRLGVYNTDGTLIYLANPIRMVCLSAPCSYTLTIQEESINKYEESVKVDINLTYNEGVFTLIYNDPSQNTDLIELEVWKIANNSRDSLICQANGTAFTGILTCNVSGQTGTLKAIVFRTASPLRTLGVLIVDTMSTVFQGTFGLLLQFLIFLTLAFLGIVSPITAIIIGVISLSVGVFAFKTITFPIFLGIAIIGGIVIHFMRRTE